MITEAIAKLVEGESLTQAEAAATMADIMEERATAAQFGAFVTALRLKGETAEEIAGMAQVMREKALRVQTDLPVTDTCGTGGDGCGTFNISTAAALVVAASGHPVAKHGNRGMSSRCGSADVLEALGVNVTLGPEAVARCIEDTGIGFMFAQTYHPAMKFAAPLRREIGIRTVFNVLGPLTNPAGAGTQVLGAPSVASQDRLAGALQLLGARRALVVHGLEGMDELSLSGPSRVLDLRGDRIETYEVHPEAFGLRPARAEEILGGDAAENAATIRAVLAGKEGGTGGPRRDIVAFNAGAALVACGGAETLEEGVRLAADVLDSGAALDTLDAFVRRSQELA
ncbi:MAG TPA: anthranilate phosphoribosyltransferase [Chloroflexota bacterium]|nr:anthranilate phosphoribosyltransferase [Chloroflexota bacterium]